MTLRRRVFIALFALALATLAVGTAATAITAKFLLGRIDAGLENGPLTIAPSSALSAVNLPSDPCALTQVLSEAVISVAQPNGKPKPLCVGQQSPVIDFASLDLKVGGLVGPFTARDPEGNSYRVLVRRFPVGYVSFGVSLGSTEATIRRVALLQLTATLFTVGGSALVGLWLLRRGVRPLDQVAETADRITGGDRTQRLDLTGHQNDEVGRVGRSLNAMLDQLDQSLRGIELSEQRLRRFVQDASHELRTPLTSMVGYTELYRSGALSTPEAVDDAMNRMGEESERMSSLVNNLLQLANFDIEPKLHLVPTNLVGLVEGAVTSARAADDRWPIQLDVETGAGAHAGCGPDADSVMANIDAHAMHQVIANLLANVRAHTSPLTLTEIGVAASQDRITVTLRDHGPGIESVILPEIFERFVQANSSRHRSGAGAGLGLSIVRSIVTAHGGTITASNHPGGGAQFVISLPRH
jgi:two-component system, OmpR family, sensor kinase